MSVTKKQKNIDYANSGVDGNIYHRANWISRIVDMFANQVDTTRNLHEKLRLDGILLLEKICRSNFKNVRQESRKWMMD